MRPLKWVIKTAYGFAVVQASADEGFQFLGVGRDEQDVSNFAGPLISLAKGLISLAKGLSSLAKGLSSFAKGLCEGRVLLTNKDGNVMRDITRERAQEVTRCRRCAHSI